MSDDERRCAPTRRRADITSGGLRKALDEIRARGDQRHADNIQRFEELTAGQQALMAKLDSHSADDLAAQQKLHDCIHENTQLTERGFREIRESMLLLVVKDTAMKTWTLAQWVRKGAVWITPVVGFALTIAWLVLWAMGKASFPLP